MFTTDAVHRAIRRHMRRHHVKSHALAGRLFACYLRPRGPVLAWHHASVESLNRAGWARRCGNLSLALERIRDAKSFREMGTLARKAA